MRKNYKRYRGFLRKIGTQYSNVGHDKIPELSTEVIRSAFRIVINGKFSGEDSITAKMLQHGDNTK